MAIVNDLAVVRRNDSIDLYIPQGAGMVFRVFHGPSEQGNNDVCALIGFPDMCAM